MRDQKFYPLRVAAVTPEGTGAVCIALSIPETLRATFHFVPGQYVTIAHPTEHAAIRRTYSICSSPDEALLQIGIREVPGGYFSPFANRHLKKGDTLQVMPPEGRFVVPDLPSAAAPHYLGLCAGSGITPLLSIIKHALKQNPTCRFTLVYGNRTSTSIMFSETLQDLKNTYLDRLQLLVLLSREETEFPFLNGRIDAQRVEQLIDKGLLAPQAASAVFVCGPGDMPDQVSAALQMHCAPLPPIITERFQPLAEGSASRVRAREREQEAEQPLVATEATAAEAPIEAVQVALIIDGLRRAFVMPQSASSLIDAAAAAGIALPYSCKEGMCATCRCQLKRGEVTLAQNYSLQPWELEAGYILACQARPLSTTLLLDFDAV